jgi:hypothetical protein
MAAARQTWEPGVTRRRAERLAAIQRSGFPLNGEVLEPIFPLRYRLSIPRTASLAKELRGMAQTTPRLEGDIQGLAVCFVQKLEHREPSDHRGGLLTSELLLPFEVLEAAAGDCDSECLLLACLLRGIGHKTLARPRGDSHMVLDVARVAGPNQRSVGVDGPTCSLCEASSGVWRAAR